MKSHNKPGRPLKTLPEAKKKVPEEKSQEIQEPVKAQPHSIPQIIQQPAAPQYQPQVYQQQPKPVAKKTPYIIPELISSPQTSNSFVQQPTALPEALNPMNLINNSTNNSNYSNSLLLPPISHHETPQIEHHFPNFESTTYLPPSTNILQNSFNFIMGGLDFSKNSLNGEPTYIDYWE